MTVTSRLQRIIADFRKRLAEHEEEAEAALNAAHARTLEAIQPVLDRLYGQIEQEMKTLPEGETIPKSWIYERLRLESIQLLITHNVDNYAALALQQTRLAQHFGVQLGQMSGMAQLQATVPTGVQWSFGVPSTKAIENLVGATQKGSPLADLFNGWGKEAADGASQALINGVTLGWNPRRIAPQVQQALNISRARALTISRNEMLRCYKSANLLTYRENRDTVSQWRWTCSKSSRTCAACLAMDGKLFDLDEEFESHVQCRCSPAPVTKSWDDLLSGLGIDTSDIPETSYTPAQTGIEWFEDQSEEMKQQILGSKAAYDLYTSGNVTLQDFVGTAYDKDWGGSRYQKSVKQLTR